MPSVRRRSHPRAAILVAAATLPALGASSCVLAILAAPPAKATNRTSSASLGPRWRGTVVFHETSVQREPAVGTADTTLAWEETTTEATVRWIFDRPPPRPRASDDLVKDVNAVGTASVTASLHSDSTNPAETGCTRPASRVESGSSSFSDLVEIQYDFTQKAWDLVLGIDDEFPYNKPPYKPRAATMTGTATWPSGCTGGAKSTTDYSVPNVIFLGKGVTGSTTAIHGTYARSITCEGIIQNPLEKNASCDPAQDSSQREDFTVTVDLHLVPVVSVGGAHRPVINGAPHPGSLLTVSLPGWTAQQRRSARFRWSRCVEPSRCVRGPTTRTYRVTSSDIGSELSVTVTSVAGRRVFTLQSAATKRITASGSGTPPVRR
jgi:hypothetical protein